MVMKKYLKKYQDYESKELARRAAKKRKLKIYKSLKSKNIIGKIKKKKRKFNPTAFTKAIGNPYNLKL